jgi:hypothetical protein
VTYAYLASCYTHKDPAVRIARYEAACKAAAKLMLSGEVIFAPIPHSHPIEQHFPERMSGEWWMSQDLPILDKAGKLIVLMLDGWKESYGVAREIEYARDKGIPIEYLEAE